MSRGQLFDVATQRIKQRVSQIGGVGRVLVTGSALSGVKIELKARDLFAHGLGLEDVRAAVAAANANMPKGAIEVGDRHLRIDANDQAVTANDYRQLIVAWRNGAAVRLGEVADVVDSVEDLHQSGPVNGEPGVQIVIYRQPGTNIVETTDQIRALVPGLAAAMPSDTKKPRARGGQGMRRKLGAFIAADVTMSLP
jgi:multidrug efflux pump